MVKDEVLVEQLKACFVDGELVWELLKPAGCEEAIAVKLVHQPTEREVESHQHLSLAGNQAAALLGMSFLLLNDRAAEAADAAVGESGAT